MGGLNFNLQDQLVFYGCYHNNRVNQLIHFIFVPAILWSLLVWLRYGGEYSLVPEAAQGSPPSACPVHQYLRLVAPDAGLALTAAYSAFYTAMDARAGGSWAACVALPLWLSASVFKAYVAHAWRWALAVHVFSWWAQVAIGHAKFEGRKPALLDSVVQAFALAPLFVWFELLFSFGYRPQLYSAVQKDVAIRLAKLAGREWRKARLCTRDA